MSAALKTPDHDGEMFYVRRRAKAPPIHAELSMVMLLTEAPTDAGVTMPAGSTGTVVGIWKDGEAYEVEFREPTGALATVKAEHLLAA